jgi:hypothetical protein
MRDPTGFPRKQAARATTDARWGDLLRGFLVGDADEVKRAGLRLGARRIGPALGQDDPLVARAAAEAAPSAEDSIWLLAVIAPLCRSADRPLAAGAARAAVRIARGADRDAILQQDVPPDWVRHQIAAYRSIAADPGRWADVRVQALEVARDLHRALRPEAAPADAPYDLAAALADPDPEIRRAAIELLPAPPEPAVMARLAAQVAADTDPVVAGAAGLVACEGLALGDPAGAVLGALGAPGLERLRQLVSDDELSLAAREGIAQCLRADSSTASKAALGRMPGKAQPR